MNTATAAHLVGQVHVPASKLAATLSKAQKDVMRRARHGVTARATMPTLRVLASLGLILDPAHKDVVVGQLTVEGEKVAAILRGDADAAYDEALVMDAERPCSRCGGTGREPGTWREDCTACAARPVPIGEPVSIVIDGGRYVLMINEPGEQARPVLAGEVVADADGDSFRVDSADRMRNGMPCVRGAFVAVKGRPVDGRASGKQRVGRGRFGGADDLFPHLEFIDSALIAS